MGHDPGTSLVPEEKEVIKKKKKKGEKSQKDVGTNLKEVLMAKVGIK